MKQIKGLSIMLCSILIFVSSPLVTIANEDEDTEQRNQDPDNHEAGDFESKDEVIYGKLDASGKMNNMYVVNTFHDTTPGQLVDYGSYKDVRNLTDLTAINMPSDNKVTFEATDSEFYYQGELEPQPLPWDISIDYYLDGEEMDPGEMAGKSGEVEIQIHTKKNDSVDPVFFNYYLQQINVTLDPEKFDDIRAPKGTKANEGKNQQITFSVMPEEEDDLIITANTEEFELDPIEINALPANIAMDDPDFSSMTGQFKTLSDAISELHAGTEQLNDGIAELNEGASELSDGSSDYRDGIHALDGKTGELIDGSNQIKDALNQMNQKVNGDIDIPDLNAMKELPDAIHEFSSDLRDTAEGFKELKGKYEDALKDLEDPLETIGDLDVSDEEMESLMEVLKTSDEVDDETVNKLVEMREAMEELKETLDSNEVQKVLTDVPERLAEIIEGIEKTADELDTTATTIEEGLDEFDPEAQMEQFQDGIATLSNEYNAFHEGLTSYTDGVSELSTSYNELDEGIQSLADNVPSLVEGANELDEGTEELEGETKDLPGDVESEIEEELEAFDFSDFEPVSFVSEKNEDMEVVQFVLQTERIDIPEKETDDTKDEEEEKESIWQRFLGLFGL